jgi:hypothetical protein
MFRVALPVLLKVTGCTPLVVPSVWLPKIRLVAVRLTALPLPVPVRITVCGLPAALSVMVTVAVRVPGAVGVNVTVIVQALLAGTELGERGHVVVSPKSPALVPVSAKVLMLKLTFPVFVRVTAWGALVVLTG